MMKRGSFIIILVVLSAFFASCLFGPSPFRGVMSYRNGKVYLKKDSFYRVGSLPVGWKRMDTRVRTISFYNADLKASISTDAFCGRAVEGQKFDTLSGEILSTLENRRGVHDEELTLDGRGAERRMVAGSLDGVEVLVDVVIVRKDGCVFDFYSVSEGVEDPQVSDAFEMFFNGFHYE